MKEQVQAERERILSLTEGLMSITPTLDKFIIEVKDWREFKKEVDK